MKWVSKNMQSMCIMEDAEFHCLMKTGQPAYWIPTAKMVATDIYIVFKQVKDCIIKMLQVSQTCVPNKLNNSHFGRVMMAT